MNVKQTIVVLAALLLAVAIEVGAIMQGAQNRYDASAAKFRGCRGHRIEGTIGSDPVRLCVTAVP